ncbi:methyltransferase domain-containing protein [Candidatus Pacearchaeota archaeon]|nr:methyltransferase domain-containing protein [Candidatus Pacearchaeota archaeon]
MENKKNLESINKKFFNEIAGYYDNFILKSLFVKALKKLIKTMGIKKNSKILDLGCGTGNLLHLLEKENKNLKLYGIDISEEMLKIAKDRLNKKTELKLISAEKIDFKNKFDYVFSTEAFHHYSDYHLIMNNIYKSLKNNGKLIVLDVDFGYFLNKIFHLIEPGNNKMHSPLEFKKLFEAHGFKNIRQKRINFLFILTAGEKIMSNSQNI